jgi:uncharacterized SAM-binding protein YcdF (DUF218 family)
MVEKLHVPANAILVEPHARHTTTNMRNTARLIFNTEYLQINLVLLQPRFLKVNISMS